MLNLEFIKTRRARLTLSMQEAAVRAGLKTRMDWNKIENGFVPDPRSSTLYGVARALECSMDELMLPPKPKSK